MKRSILSKLSFGSGKPQLPQSFSIVSHASTLSSCVSALYDWRRARLSERRKLTIRRMLSGIHGNELCSYFVMVISSA